MPLAYMSSHQLLVLLRIKPTVTPFRPDVRPVSKLNVNPTLGMPARVSLLFIVLWKYGSALPSYGTPVAVFVENVREGVSVICEYPATALPAGLIETAPRSPPSAVKALPIATDRAVPS